MTGLQKWLLRIPGRFLIKKVIKILNRNVSKKERKKFLKNRINGINSVDIV